MTFGQGFLKIPISNYLLLSIIISVSLCFLNNEDAYSQALNNESIIDTLLEKAKQFLDNYKYQEAKPYYDEVLEIEPFNSEALTNKGVLFHDLGNDSEALKYYDKALIVNPNSIDILSTKANTLTILGKYQEAIQ